MRANDFEFSGGRIIENHKSNWPDSLNITMSRYDAWNLATSILNQLRDEKEDTIKYSVCGKLDVDIEE